jgi:hypothetical protein
MPRVNRDTQRRMAARRERDRRRPATERRYNFGAEPLAEADELPESLESQAAIEDGPVARRQPRRDAPAAATASRGSTARPYRAFASYRDEYTYVLSDLRRVALVMGSLLVVLIVLSFVLPH